MPQRPVRAPCRPGRLPVSAGLYEITVNALLDRGVAIGAAGWASAAARVGHERVPALLVELTDADLVTADVLPRAVADAWSGPRRPAQRLDPEQWVQLFGDAGYAVDGVPATRPSAPVRLYRVAGEEHPAGLGWAGQPAPGTVWTTLASPEALLARFTAPDGDVHVVDPALLGAIMPA